ncbi:MAG: hypothetical protein QXP67_04000 [Desulfurococcaceae archaeon]
MTTPDFWLEEKIRVTVNELKYVRSVDGFLVKLSSLLYDIQDECLGDSSCTKSCLEKALNHPMLREELSKLSCYVDMVEKMVTSDPRFKSLRDYADLLIGVLRGIECVGSLPEVSREPTFRIERKVTAEQEIVKPVEKARRVNWSRLVVYVSIAVAIALVITALLRLLL